MSENYNCDYDHYLEFCLDLLSEKQYEYILFEMINMDRKEWFKVNIIQHLSSFPDNIYFFCETLPNINKLLFIFVNIDTLEMNTAIYHTKS